MAVTNNSASYLLKGDVARVSIADDEFGLKDIVVVLAKVLTAQVNANGYVLGLQGEWGSGKSSFANYVEEEVRRRAPTHNIIRFEPWLVGEKSALLATYLGQLASGIDRVQDAQTRWWRLDYWLFNRSKKLLAAKVRKYGEYAAVLAAPASSAAVSDPTGATAAAAAGLRAVGYLKKLLGSGPTLEELKKSIATDLKQLQLKSPTLRFLTIIDDTDRLEPVEAMEVLRLVRKVADFPLVTYLVCFDHQVLVRQVQAESSIDNGAEFIEKIFQNVITVPPQEPFALRRYLRKLLASDFSDTLARASFDRDASYREHLVLDVWSGRFLRTPRDVIRLHEAVKLAWPHTPVGTDFWDFVWLQLVKLKCPKLFDWTQSYLMEIASYRDGGRPGDDEPADQATKLADIMGEFRWDKKGYHSGLGTILPGISAFVLEGDKRRVFEFSSGELARFEASCRLGSPTHWRQYFAFSLPSYALSDEHVVEFRDAAAKGDVSRGTVMVRSLMNRPHHRKGHFLDVLLDRVWDAKQRGGLSETEAVGLAPCIC